jgi:hypothetical protein
MRTEKRIAWYWNPLVVLPAFAACFLVARLVPGSLEGSSGLRLGLALLIIPGLLYLFAAQRQWVRQLDELERRIHLEAYVTALAVILLAVFTLHILLKAGFLLPGVEFMDVVAFGYIAGFIGGVFFARRRYL